MLCSNTEFIVLKGFDPKKDGNCLNGFLQLNGDG